MARDIDSVVKVRVVATSIAAGGIGKAGLTEAGALDNLLNTFRRSFRDFLSLEVLDPHGEVIAMAGELPLSQARRFSGIGGAERPLDTASSQSQVFHDDPAANNFYITVRLEAKDGTVWYSRTRFSRESIKKILSSGGDRWTAGLAKISDKEANSGGCAGAAAGSFGTWWDGRDTAAVPLQTAGWIVNLAKPSRVLFSKGPVILVAVILLLAVVVCLYRRITSDGHVHLSEMAAVPNPACHARESEDKRSTEYQRSFALQASDCDDSSRPEGQDYPDYDIWTPRNVPIGMVDSAESESLECEVPATGPASSLREDEKESSKWSEAAEESPVAEQGEAEVGLGESPAVSDEGDLPETIEVTWFEPIDSSSAAGAENETDPSQALPEAETRRYAIPESLEVSWSEPSGDAADDLRDERKKDYPTRYHSA